MKRIYLNIIASLSRSSGHDSLVYNQAINDVCTMLTEASRSLETEPVAKNTLFLCSQELNASNKIDGNRLSNAIKAFKGIDLITKKEVHEKLSKQVLH